MDGIAVMAYLDGIGGGPVQPSLEGIEQVNIELAGTQAEFARAANSMGKPLVRPVRLEEV